MAQLQRKIIRTVLKMLSKTELQKVIIKMQIPLNNIFPNSQTLVPKNTILLFLFEFIYI